MIEHMKMLGHEVKDIVTGFEGVVTSISFDLYGCVQAIVSPKAKEGEVKDGRWLDTNRLIVTSKSPVMTPPSFTKADHGCADKPIK